MCLRGCASVCFAARRVQTRLEAGRNVNGPPMRGSRLPAQSGRKTWSAEKEGTMIEQRGFGRRLRSVRFVLLACVAAALCLVPGASMGQEGGGYQNLEPGGRADLDEQVPVNFVFVGYKRDDVDLGGFIGGLPKEYKPVVRSEYLQIRPFQKDSVKKSLLGVNYTYDYKAFFADS